MAGYTTRNNGLIFNGASRGQLVVSIPVGYKLTVTLINRAATRHSAEVTAYANRDGVSFPPAFPGAATPQAATGIAQGAKQTFTFTASAVGTYALVCAVPGHAAAGMWDTLKVTRGGPVSLTNTAGRTGRRP